MIAYGYCEFVFGKRWKDLSTEERKQYYALMKQRSRNLDPKSKEKAQRYYEENKEKIKATHNKWASKNKDIIKQKRKAREERDRLHKPYENTLSFQMFGCRVKDMNPEQLRIYNNVRCLRYQQRKRDERRQNTETHAE